MDEALSDILAEDDAEDFAASFADDNTPPAGANVGDMDALSELLDEEEEDDTNIAMGLTEESTPPASSQMSNMEEELKDLLMSDEMEDFTEEIPL